MAENSLRPGDARLGWLYDGDPDTPDIAVMLQDTGEQIVLSLPLRGLADSGQYFRWFGQGINFGDDPDRTRFSYQPPRVLMFEDERGHVVLAGCRAVGSNLNMGAGVGRIVPNFAVLDGRTMKYDRLHGLRTEIPGLGGWAGVTSIQQEPHIDAKGRVQSLDVRLDSPSRIALARQMNLAFYPTWRTSSSVGRL